MKILFNRFIDISNKQSKILSIQLDSSPGHSAFTIQMINHSENLRRQGGQKSIKKTNYG